MSIQIGALFGQIVLQDNFTNVLNNVQSSVVHAGRTLNNFGSAAMGAGTALSIGLTAPLVAAAVASTKFAVDFDQSMTRVVTLSGVSEEQMHSFRDSIMELAPAVGVGPDALAQGLLKITSAGERGEEAINILTIAAKASAVGLGEVAVVGDAITSIINAYGKENMEAARAAEVLFKTVVEGKGEADELAGVLGRVVGVTAEMGVSFEEVGSFLATYTRLGVDASESTTALRGVMMALLDPTEQSQEALKLAGTSAQELRDKIRKDGLTAAMTELILSLKDSEGAVAKVFGNVRALAGILGTVGSQAEASAQILAKLSEDTDDLGAAFTRVGETPAFTMDVLKAKLEVLAITVGNQLIPVFVTFMDAMKPLIDTATSLVKWFGEMPVMLQNAAMSFLAVSAAAGPLLFLFGGMAQGVGSLVKLYGMLQIGTVAVTASTTAAASASVAAAGGIASVGASAAVATPAVGGLSTGMGLLSAAMLPVTVAVAGLIYLWKSGNFEKMADEIEYLTLVMSGHSQESARAAVVAHRLVDAEIAKEKAIQALVEGMAVGEEALRRYTEQQQKAVPPTVDAADKLRALHRAAKEFREEALKPLSEGTQQMIHDFTLAGQSASEIAGILGENEGAVMRVVAAERERLKSLEDIADAQNLMKESVVDLTDVEEALVLTYDKLGHSASKIALAFGLNAAAVTRFLEEERKIIEVTKKSVEETGELWRELALLKIERSGTSTQYQLAQIEKWRQDEIAKLDASDKNWQAHYDAINAIAGFSTESQLVDFEKLKEGSRAEAKEAMDLAKRTYDYAIHHSRIYSAEKIAMLRQERDEAVLAYATWGQAAVTAAGSWKSLEGVWGAVEVSIASANGEQQKFITSAQMAADVTATIGSSALHALRGVQGVTEAMWEAAVAAAALNRAMGGSFEITGANDPRLTDVARTGGVDEGALRQLLREGYSVEQAMQILRGQARRSDFPEVAANRNRNRPGSASAAGGGSTLAEPTSGGTTIGGGSTAGGVGRSAGRPRPRRPFEFGGDIPVPGYPFMWSEDGSNWWYTREVPESGMGRRAQYESEAAWREAGYGGETENSGTGSGRGVGGRSPRFAAASGTTIVIEKGAVVIDAVVADTKLIDKAAELISEAVMRRQLTLGRRVG